MSALGYGLEIRGHDPVNAARLLGLHAAAFEKDRLARRPRHEKLFRDAHDELEESLGEEAFQAAWDEGAAISPLDVMSLMPNVELPSLAET
jgi:hypothetical protein